ncbi:MAG: copper(I)-binding protein [Psychromonas sp.]|jgi:copper(I)-binding protein|uniref:copper chaperone PCu(A)C n=1 Tax=Psychromonas sp. TaxID=1884585 RepID=UPI0039E4FE54
MKSILSLLIAGFLFISNTAFANLTIENAYVRATPPHAKNSAAFMVIHNSNKEEVKLIAASSDIAQRVELHNHLMQDGLMKMRQVKQISIKAKNKTALQPGSYHVMFFELKQPLKDGESVALKLYFDNGEEITVDAPIKKITMHKNKTD